MRKFFISSHGSLASGFLSSAKVLLGEGNTANITVFDAYLDQDTVESHVEAWLKTLKPEDQGIMLSDLYGGSVNSVLYRYTSGQVFLIAGVNLALVLELAAQPEAPVDAAMLEDLARQSGQMIRLCLPEKAEPEEGAEDFL